MGDLFLKFMDHFNVLKKTPSLISDRMSLLIPPEEPLESIKKTLLILPPCLDFVYHHCVVLNCLVITCGLSSVCLLLSLHVHKGAAISRCWTRDDAIFWLIFWPKSNHHWKWGRTFVTQLNTRPQMPHCPQTLILYPLLLLSNFTRF